MTKPWAAGRGRMYEDHGEAGVTNPWAAGRLTAGHGAQVLFGRMYEDHGVECGLFPPGSRVLAIASAGDTAAALARAGHRVTAVDVNARQLAYARSRLAGGPTVDGVAEHLQRLARAAAASVVPGWRPAALREFLELDDPDAQRDWWHRRLDRPALRALMYLALRPAGVVRRDLWRALPPRFDRVLRERLAAAVSRFPNATNPWMWRLLLGRDGPCAEPAAAGTGRVTFVHAEVTEHLRQVPRGWYDAATLSNVLDGPPPEAAAALRTALRHAVRPDGPVVLRSFRDRAPLPGTPLTDRSPLWGSVTRLDPTEQRQED